MAVNVPPLMLPVAPSKNMIAISWACTAPLSNVSVPPTTSMPQSPVDLIRPLPTESFTVSDPVTLIGLPLEEIVLPFRSSVTVLSIVSISVNSMSLTRVTVLLRG